MAQPSYAIESDLKFISVYDSNHELIKAVGKKCPWKDEALKGIKIIKAIQLDMLTEGD